MKKLFLIALLSVLVYSRDIYATFNVKAKRSASLAFNAGGIVNKVLVDIGSQVKKGDILATLKNSDLKASLQLNLTELKYAKKDYNRINKAKSVIDKAMFDKFAFKKDIALAKVKLQKALIDKTILKAPFDGVIFYKNIEVGDVVTGMNPKMVFGIETLHEKKLVLEFDQKYFGSVKKGDKFKYSFDGSNKTYSGVISKVYPNINPIARKAKAEVEVANVPSGLFGVGTIEVE